MTIFSHHSGTSVDESAATLPEFILMPTGLWSPALKNPARISRFTPAVSVCRYLEMKSLHSYIFLYFINVPYFLLLAYSRSHAAVSSEFPDNDGCTTPCNHPGTSIKLARCRVLQSIRNSNFLRRYIFGFPRMCPWFSAQQRRPRAHKPNGQQPSNQQPAGQLPNQ